MRDYTNFTDFLAGQRRGAVLFEPLVNRRLVTQIIWRGGDNLWDTPAHRTDTLIEFYSYIKSDVAIIEAFGDTSEILDSAILPDGMKLVIISDDPDELDAADSSDKVCALATRGKIVNCEKPLILIARDGESPDETFARSEGFSALYLRERADEFAEKAIVLGGFGVDSLEKLGPLDVYKRVEELNSLGCAIGSGAVGEYCEYLGFISMLGMYNKLNNN